MVRLTLFLETLTRCQHVRRTWSLLSLKKSSKMCIRDRIGLEIEALIKEHEETRAKIAEYSDILEHRSSMAKVIMKELCSASR